MILLTCGIISKNIATDTIIASRDPWLALKPMFNVAAVTILAIFIYLAAAFSKKIYQKYHWWVVAILCALILLTGVLLSYRANS
jgi:hypothetical protein